jgi:hypothetical protein
LLITTEFRSTLVSPERTRNKLRSLLSK